MKKHYYLIKFYVPVKGDMFGMKEPGSAITVYCSTLVDFTKTLRCLMAKGYRVKRPATWGQKFKRSAVWESINLFGNKTYIAKRVTSIPAISKTIDYTNGWGYTHKIKLTEVDFEKAN